MAQLNFHLWAFVHSFTALAFFFTRLDPLMFLDLKKTRWTWWKKVLKVRPTPWKTNSKRPWKWAIPKGNNRIPTIHFQVQTVSFREGTCCMYFKKDVSIWKFFWSFDERNRSKWWVRLCTIAEGTCITSQNYALLRVYNIYNTRKPYIYSIWRFVKSLVPTFGSKSEFHAWRLLFYLLKKLYWRYK